MPSKFLSIFSELGFDWMRILLLINKAGLSKLNSLHKVCGRLQRALPKLYDLSVEVLTGEHRVMTKSQSTYWGDNSATLQHVEFLQDPRFQEARMYTLQDAPKHLANSIASANIDWRLHICTWAASRCANLEGDFVECGVWYGWLSRAMCKYIDFNRTGKSFHFF